MKQSTTLTQHLALALLLSMTLIQFGYRRLSSPFTTVFSPFSAPLIAFASHMCVKALPGNFSLVGQPEKVKPVRKVSKDHSPHRDANEEEGRGRLVQSTLLTHEVPLKHKAKVTLSAQFSLCPPSNPFPS